MTTDRFDHHTLKAAFETSLSKYQDRIAVRAPGRGETLTYGDIDTRSNVVATALRERGVEQGDRVALLLSNRVEYVITDLAVIKAGGVKVPLNDMLNEGDINHILGDSRTETIVCGPNFIETIADLEPDLPALERVVAIADDDTSIPDGFERFSRLEASANGDTSPDVDIDESDVVAQYYTGGTTGKPKGVLQSHRSMTLNAYAHVIEMSITGDDTLLLMTPLPHSAGLFLWGCLLTGATAVIRPGFDAEQAVADIESFGVTWTFFVPTMIYRLLDLDNLDDYDISSIGTLAYGAAPMTPSRLKEGIDAFGHVFVQFYGQTEVPNLITTFGKQEHEFAIKTNTEDRLSSAGTTCLMSRIKVVDLETGEKLPPGEEGEVLATAPYAMEQYFERPEKTTETVTDGWIHTGDVGKLDEDGYLYLLDRESDVIITGGMNVYSTEVEEAIDQHPDVVEVAVIGIPNEEWGEAVHAVVVPSPDIDLTSEDIRAVCDEQLSEYKTPKSIEFVDDIPKTPYGKQDKVALRDRHWEEEDREIA